MSIPKVNLPSFSNVIINNNDPQIQVSNHTQITPIEEFHFIPPTWTKNEKKSYNMVNLIF